LQVDPDELLNRGTALRREGRCEEALAVFEQILQVVPGHADALHGCGLALAALGRYPEAVTFFAKVVELAPMFAEGQHNHGLALARTLRHQEALKSYERALELEPGYVDALNSFSESLFWLGRYAESIEGYERALAARPDSIAALNNRSRSLVVLGRFEEALAGYERALSLKPDLAEAWAGRASALAKLGRYEESLESSGYALRIWPDFVDAHLVEAYCRLRMGDFRSGLPKYEWRRLSRAEHVPGRKCSGSRWTGKENLQGKTILLRSEQGFGDVILFSRYAGLVSDRGAKVVLEVPAGLAPLMAGMAGVGGILIQGEEPPSVDFHCQLPSLPLAFNTELPTIPAEVPYLAARPEKIRKWEANFSSLRGMTIGLTWSGNARQLDDRARSIPLKQLAPLLSVRGTQFVCVQKDIRPDDAATLRNAKIVDLSDQLGDFSDTAAIISLLDLVITVDTSVAHLAGALGKPVWVMLPFMAYWPWFLEREDSPWYPSARLFRQAKLDDWDGVVSKVKKELTRTLGPATRKRSHV